ncbi:MAG TPA: SDR family NAD(P)-dependent oxidoreductase [Atribacteraceae bacterium]|nr:SDR family NAD(P)-dependent oxidoreductase [Atribacteraceae bacterium]
MKIENIVVTGASKGIGRAISLKLVSSGMTVFALARHRETLKELTVWGGEKNPHLSR